jgi:hypothetical protein
MQVEVCTKVTPTFCKSSLIKVVKVEMEGIYGTRGRDETSIGIHITIFRDIASCNLALIMEVVHTSETSVYFNETTRRYISQKAVISILAAVRT